MLEYCRQVQSVAVSAWHGLFSVLVLVCVRGTAHVHGRHNKVRGLSLFALEHSLRLLNLGKPKQQKHVYVMLVIQRVGESAELPC